MKRSAGTYAPKLAVVAVAAAIALSGGTSIVTVPRDCRLLKPGGGTPDPERLTTTAEISKSKVTGSWVSGGSAANIQCHAQ